MGLVWSPTVAAEGGCPPGHYPIGGQGVVGCAPIPGAATSGGSQQQIPVPSPVSRGYWVKTWGVIAGDVDEGSYGAVTGHENQEAAEAAARAKCVIGGGRRCETVFVYHNQCAAMYRPLIDASVGIFTYNGAPTIELAESLGKTACESRNGGKCEVFYSACSEPIYKYR